MIDILESELAELRRKIDAADAAYYRPGFQPILSDQDYEVLKSNLRALAPADPRHTRVGAPYSTDEIGKQKAHLMPMGSLDNTKDGILGLEDWYNKIIAKLATGRKLTHQVDTVVETVLTQKIDGSSIAANYESGVLVSVISRGNGTVGEDITANAMHFLPTVLPVPLTCSIRGEAVLYKQDFLAITHGRAADDKTNPRNIGNGILGRSDGENAHLMRFIAFNIQAGDDFKYDTVEQKLRMIAGLGFQTVYFEVCDSVECIEEFYDRTQQQRADLPYGIDGCVVELNSIVDQNFFVTADPKSRLRPKYARANKFPMYSSQTKMVGVTVSVGHTGSIIPTAQLARVWVGGDVQGVNVENALLTNYDEVQRLDLAIGDTVEVALAGDIIPKIVRVTDRPADRRPIVEPTRCPSCGDVTTRENRGKIGANLYCSNEDCTGVMVGKIHHWIGNSKKGVGILDIGDTMERALYEANLVSDPSDLYTLTTAAIENVLLNGKTRIGRSRAEKIVANIQGKKQLPLSVFLGALGIELLGRRRVILLATAAGGELDRLEDWLDDEKLASIRVAGLGDEIRQAIRMGINRCKPLIHRLLQNGVEVLPMLTASSTEMVEFEEGVNRSPDACSFAGLNFVFTGTREGITEVETRGGHVQDGVRKDTHYLVCKDATKMTAKAQKAQAAGVKVITLDRFKSVVAGQAELP